jgi:hypothetical protein
VADQGGLRVHAAIVLGSSGPELEIGVENSQPSSVDKMAVAVNKNGFGLTATAPVASFGGVSTGGSGSASVPLTFDATKATPVIGPALDVALRDNTSRAQIIFKVPVNIVAVLAAGGAVAKDEFIPQWRSLVGAGQEHKDTVSGVANTAVDALTAKLAASRVGFIARRAVGAGQEVAYFAARTAGAPGAGGAGVSVLVEITVKEGMNMVRLVVRTPNGAVTQPAWESIAAVLRS